MSPSIELPEMHKYSTTATHQGPFDQYIFCLHFLPIPNTIYKFQSRNGLLSSSKHHIFTDGVSLVHHSLIVCYCEGGKPSVYEVLQQYHFPIGILPVGVTDYELNTETGHFSAYLSGTCSFSIEGSYKLEYKPTITGVLSKGRLKDLKGVSVKVLFFWFSIVEVVRVGDDLQFSVGIASANFPVSNFEERPQCGCGLDCNQLRTPLPEYPVGTC